MHILVKNLDILESFGSYLDSESNFVDSDKRN